VKPEQLRARADELDAESEKLIRAGDLLRGVPLGVEANRMRAAADQTEAAALTGTSHSGKKRAMLSVARMHISESKSEDDPLKVAVNEAGYTMRTLETELRAEGYRCSRQFLMQCRQGEANIRESLAKAIETKLGKDAKGRPRFAATRKNWPGNAWAKEPTEG
jgi:hypothetical protein